MRQIFQEVMPWCRTWNCTGDAQRKVTSEQRGKEKSCVTWISIIFNNIGKDFFFDKLDDLKSYHFTTNRGKTIMELHPKNDLFQCFNHF